MEICEPLKYVHAVCILIFCGHVQPVSSGVAVLEVTGSKGYVMHNRIAVAKDSKRLLHSGDEVVFGSRWSSAYVSSCLSTLFICFVFFFF